MKPPKIPIPPTLLSLKRCWPWQPWPDIERDLASFAHHEAGHIVMLEWFNLPGERRATATETGGQTHPGVPPGAYHSGPSDESGLLAATAASAFHAGLMAEMILTGTDWYGPIHYPDASDFQEADEMLRERFGKHSSAGHAFAQRTAWHILAMRWARVQEIADVLVQRGAWP